MNDQWLHDLMSETAETIEPEHGLDQIRQRTAAADRRRPWAIGGSVLAAAAAVTAIAVVVNGLGDDTDTAPGPSKSPTETVTEPTKPAKPARDFIADRPGANLIASKVEASATSQGFYDVTALWSDPKADIQEFVTVSAGGKETQIPYTDKRYSQLFDLTYPTDKTQPPLDDMLVRPIHSMQPGVSAVIGGGDGTEGLTFERVASTNDDGATWQSFDIPEVDGQQSLFSGGVVLRDGRLLVLLNSATHDVLWISDGADWSTLTPLEVQLPGVPAVGTNIVSIGGDAKGPGTLWLQYANRLFVSSGDPEDFTEVATH